MITRTVAISLCAFAFSSAQAQSPSYETVSRCFFVYAPITQLGSDLPHAQLFQFGQPRIGWVGGYVQANQSNAAFKQVFESNLDRNKHMGMQLETSLRQAILSRNQGQFASLLNQAVDCDRALGIRTAPLPTL